MKRTRRHTSHSPPSPPNDSVDNEEDTLPLQNVPVPRADPYYGAQVHFCGNRTNTARSGINLDTHSPDAATNGNNRSRHPGPAGAAARRRNRGLGAMAAGGSSNNGLRSAANSSGTNAAPAAGDSSNDEDPTPPPAPEFTDWEPCPYPSDAVIYAALGDPQPPAECFGCRYISENCPAIKDTSLEALVRELLEGQLGADPVSHCRSVEAHYIKKIRCPVNASRRIGENSLPEWRAATIYAHLSDGHTCAPDNEVFQMMRRASTIARTIYRNSLCHQRSIELPAESAKVVSEVNTSHSAGNITANDDATTYNDAPVCDDLYTVLADPPVDIPPPPKRVKIEHRTDLTQYKIFESACKLYITLGKCRPHAMPPYSSMKPPTFHTTEAGRLIDMANKNLYPSTSSRAAATRAMNTGSQRS